MKGVYKITNTANGRFYIGSTKNSFSQRWGLHRSELKRNRHANQSMQDDWNKFGSGAFCYEVLAELENDNEIIDMERELVRQYSNSQDCYNMVMSTTNYGVPLTATERQRRRQEQLDRIAQALGYDTWRKLETAILNGEFRLPEHYAASGRRDDR